MNKHDRRKPPIGLWSAIDELELIPVGGACGDRFDRAYFFRNRHGRDRGQFAGAIAPRGIRGGCIRSGAGLHCLFEVGTLLITEGRPAPHLLPQRLRTLPSISSARVERWKPRMRKTARRRGKVFMKFSGDYVVRLAPKNAGRALRGSGRELAPEQYRL